MDSTLIKTTGATFTPPKLADFISEKILSYLTPDNQKIRVLDPACGEGALLTSISIKLSDRNKKHCLIGFDSNKDYLKIAKQNLISICSNKDISLSENDFLEKIYPESKQKQFEFEGDRSKDFINSSIDLIIANPPYVRTQLLGTKYAQEISKKFNLKGRVDLYYPFLIGMTYALKENGLIGVITSNRYLSTKSGISIREFLKNNYEILEIIDLGDSKLFDAAVLPAIFIGRKKSYKNIGNALFTKVYEEFNENDSDLKSVPNFYDILKNRKDGYFSVSDKIYKKSSGHIKFINSKDSTWALLTNTELKWVNKIDQASNKTIGDYFKVKIGIKTTADKVFIRENWEIQKNIPEPDLLKDLISQENIQAWDLSSNKKLKVLYPHYSLNGKKQTIDLKHYPKANKYLNEYWERLNNRKYLIDAGRQWYEIWVPQNPSLWEKPKLVFPDISSFPRFHFDESKRIVNGNCYWIVAKKSEEVDLLLLIQGISNSQLMTKYHSLMFNNKLYSGKRRYFAQFVEKYPLPDISSNESKKIISIVKKINKIKNKQKEILIQKLEVLVANAFNVEPLLSLS